MRTRILSPLVLTALAIGLALPAAAAAVTIPKLPKTPKVTQYPVTIDVVGYLDYTWTYDTRARCVLGYAKTIDEHFGFELGRARAAHVSVVDGKVMMFPLKGGDGTVETELRGWQTTNYCPPTELAPEPPEPTCKKLKGPLGVGLGPVHEAESPEDPTPLVRDVQIAIFRFHPQTQTLACHANRPSIETEFEATRGWHADPYTGIVAPLGATDRDFLRLGVGQRLKRTIEIGGGCGGATLGAHASAIPANVTSCVLKGRVVVTIRRTGKGFG